MKNASIMQDVYLREIPDISSSQTSAFLSPTHAWMAGIGHRGFSPRAGMDVQREEGLTSCRHPLVSFASC